MKKGTIGVYRKPDGREERRVHFPEWELDGSTLRDVTVFPHLCSACAGGDHSHVEINDTRSPIRIIIADAVEFPPEVVETIDAYLRQKIAVDKMTDSMHRIVETVARALATAPDLEQR